MCWNISKILFIEVLEYKMVKFNNKFFVGNLLSICGWLVYVNILLYLLQVDLMVNIVLDCDTERSGLLVKYKLQDWNRISSFDRNIIVFGFFRQFLFLKLNLKKCKIKIKINKENKL